MFYRSIFRPFLFALEAEKAHQATFEVLKFIQKNRALKAVLSQMLCYAHLSLSSDLFGCHFANPIGLAAGFDKNCEIFDVIPCFGFGFVECGTVTAKDQSGNPGPRIFRLVKQSALINRLGFNNRGALWVES